ncbi:MAG: hypothetical protein ACTH5C_13835 [Pseudoalteromonas prydzensis]
MLDKCTLVAYFVESVIFEKYRQQYLTADQKKQLKDFMEAWRNEQA